MHCMSELDNDWLMESYRSLACRQENSTVWDHGDSQEFFVFNGE